MAALRSSCGHFCPVSSSFFLFFPRLISSGRRLDVYHILLQMVCPSTNLKCRYEICYTRLSGNAGPKNRQNFTIWAPSHNFVRLYLCKYGTYRQSEKNLLNINVSPTCPHSMVNFCPLAGEICWRVWGTPAILTGFASWQRYCTAL